MVSYKALISTCEKGKQTRQALHWLMKMQFQGLMPNVITYGAAISACAKGQEPRQALQSVLVRRAKRDVGHSTLARTCRV